MHVSAFSKDARRLGLVFRFFALLVDFSHTSKCLIRANSPNVMPVHVSAFCQAKVEMDFRVARRALGSLFEGHFHQT